MKAALLHAHPLAFNAQRTWLAVAVLFVALPMRGGRVWPQSRHCGHCHGGLPDDNQLRRAQAIAIAFACAGLLLVVAPWAWGGDLAPKLWAVLSGFGWAAGHRAYPQSNGRGKCELLLFTRALSFAILS